MIRGADYHFSGMTLVKHYIRNYVMDKTSIVRPNVAICCVSSRDTSFILAKFLVNQQEIQHTYQLCNLLMATTDIEYAIELRKEMVLYQLRAEVITYETVKPDYAESRSWNVACGREALRKYAISSEADYLLILDTDMLYETSIIDKLILEAQNYDIVFSGYRARIWNTLTFGAGCLLIKRKIYEKIPFRCIEFKNKVVIQEDELFEMDSFRAFARVKKGIFMANKHYRNKDEYFSISPGSVRLIRKLTTKPIVRYLLIKIEILLRCRIADKIYSLLLRKSLITV